MGRPLNKRFFGNPATTAGNQMYLQADVGAGLEQCFFIKQKNTKTFLVQSVASSTQAEVRLVSSPALVTGKGFGYLEAGSIGSNQEAESVSVAVGGSGYSVANTVTVDGTGTDPVFNIESIVPVAGQTQLLFDNVGVNGTFFGGIGFVNDEVITLNDGTTVTVNTHAVGVVATFTITTVGTTAQTADDVVLAQTSATVAGTGFTLTLDDANQAISTVSVLTAGSLSVAPANPAASTSNGAGINAALNVIYGSVDDTFVTKISNRSVRTTGSPVKESFTVNSENSDATRDITGE